MSFRVGQKVVCVDASVRAGKDWLFASPLVDRAIYTISGFATSPYDGSSCIALDGMKHPWGYRSSRFRPVVERKTDISIFTAILTGAKQPEVA